MIIYKIKRTQYVNVSAEKAWEFFSSPANLNAITPDDMEFFITEEIESKMYPGQIISYIIKPLLNIPMRWVTEITHVHEPDYFVDEQRFGPYKFWHHKHFIIKAEGGVRIMDIVHYGLGFGFFGSIINKLIVRKKIEGIFDFREKKIKEIFG